MRAPSASSTSAEPLRPVAERLPCLATAQPAPAATSAAVVDTLKVRRPPPVPAVSSRSVRCVATGVASPRIAAARPAISSTVSPLVRSAIRKAAICPSLPLPAMISPSTAPACSWLRSRRVASASMAAVRTSLGIGKCERLTAWRAVVAQASARKLASMSLPRSVRTDSGWNWTPSTGSSRWRMPIRTPPPREVTVNASGRSSSATTSEW